MIDHASLSVTNAEKSRAFYETVLAPIGYRMLMQIPVEYTGGRAVMGFGAPPRPDFWIADTGGNEPKIHVAFRAETREQVDAFHRAAMAFGAKDNGAPGLRPMYHPDYYGAFVLDPDGHNIEVVCHGAGEK